MKISDFFKKAISVSLVGVMVLSCCVTAFAENQKTSSGYLFDVLGDNTYNYDKTINQYSEYAQLAFPKLECAIPGVSNGYVGGVNVMPDNSVPLQTNYVPQGVDYNEKEDLYFITAYDYNKVYPTVIYVLDGNGNYKCTLPVYTNSSYSTMYQGHAGGISSDENFIYIVNGLSIRKIPLSQVKTAVASGNDCVNVYISKVVTLTTAVTGVSTGSDSTVNDFSACSYCTYYNGLLWVGEFCESGSTSYPDRTEAYLFGLDMSAETPVCKKIMTVPENTQGVAFFRGGDNNIYLACSTSYGRKNCSYIYLYRPTLSEWGDSDTSEAQGEQASKSLGKFVHKNGNIRKLEMPNMTEDMCIRKYKGKVYLQTGYESAAYQYHFATTSVSTFVMDRISAISFAQAVGTTDPVDAQPSETVTTYAPTYENREKAGLSAKVVDADDKTTACVPLNSSYKIVGSYFLALTNNSTQTVNISKMYSAANDRTANDNLGNCYNLESTGGFSIKPGETEKIRISSGAYEGNYQMRLFIDYTMDNVIDIYNNPVKLEAYCNQSFKYVAVTKPSMRVYDSGITTSDRTVDANVSLVADKGLLTAQGNKCVPVFGQESSYDYKNDLVSMVVDYYVDYGECPTWKDAGFAWQFITNSANTNPMYFNKQSGWAGTVSIGGTYSSLGSVGWEGAVSTKATAKDTATQILSNNDLSNVKGTVTKVAWTGDMPKGSNSSTGPWKLTTAGVADSTSKGLQLYVTNGKNGNSSYFNVTLNVYSYDKTALKETISKAQNAGYISAYYDESVWQSYYSAYQAAAERNGMVKTNEKAVADDNAALVSAVESISDTASVTKGCFVVNHNDYGASPRTEEMQVENVTTVYYINDTIQSVMIPCLSSLSSRNKHSYPIGVDIEKGKTKLLDYYYWTIDTTDLIYALDKYKDYLIANDKYCQYAFRMLNDAYNYAKRCAYDDLEQPFFQNETVDMVHIIEDWIVLLNHDTIMAGDSPLDKTPGNLYYWCQNCNKNLVSNNGVCGDEFDPNTELEKTDVVPAPSFNTYVNEVLSYDYSLRGASLRIEPEADADHQNIRFTASMEVPKGAEIMYYGYVYSQEQYINNVSDLVKYRDNIYDKFCENHTVHSEGENDVYTFNLVINTKYTNWDKVYVARAYVMYFYLGQVYTVYDESYSSRSVVDVANKVVASDSERESVKEYVRSHILDRLGI